MICAVAYLIHAEELGRVPIACAGPRNSVKRLKSPRIRWHGELMRPLAPVFLKRGLHEPLHLNGIRRIIDRQRSKADLAIFRNVGFRN